MLDLHRDQIKELSGRDPREYNLPALASVLLGAFLLSVGFSVGFAHVAFWLGVASSVGLVALLERRLRRFIEAWGDDTGLMLSRAGEFEKVSWSDVAAVENRYSLRCVVRFRRDTSFGRTLAFQLPFTNRLIGLEHPNAVWMRHRVEAAGTQQ